MIGITRTNDIVMPTRRTRPACLRLGHRHQLVPDDELAQATDRMVAGLCESSPLAQHTAKRLLNQTEDMLLSPAIEPEGYATPGPSRLPFIAHLKNFLRRESTRRARAGRGGS